MSNVAFFDAFAPHYSAYYTQANAAKEVRRWTQTLEQQGMFSENRKGARSRMRLLDLGCGPGWHLREWEAQGFQVSGIDASPVMLEAAAKNADAGRRGGIGLYCADILDTKSLEQIHGDFNWVVGHFNLLNLFKVEDLPFLFSSARRLLAPHGKFAAEVSFWNGTVDRGELSGCIVSKACELLQPIAHPDAKRIECIWRLAGQAFQETYWFHSLDQILTTAAACRFELALQLPTNALDILKITYSSNTNFDQVILVFSSQ